MRLHDYLDYRAREHPELVFARQGARSLTYAEARDEANRLAWAFTAAGIEAGERVGVLAKNSIEQLLFFYGASKAGVVPVPLNYRLAPPEWRYILEDAGAKLVCARGALIEALDAVRGDLPGVKRWIAIDAGEPGPAGSRPAHRGWESWDAFLADAAPAAPERHVPADADLYQMYTSGTTGRPKGAVLSQRAVCMQIHQASMVMGGRPGEAVLLVAPLYHAAAAVSAFVAVQAGASLVIHEDFVPAEVVRSLSEEHIGMTTLVPAMIQACLVFVPDARSRAYPDLRLVVYGASPIAESTLRDAMATFGCEFLQGYGMTETTAAVTYLLPEDHRRALSGEPGLLLSAGRPLPGTEVRVVDEHGRPLPPGCIGEVVARGPQLMRGYWNLADATREALREGWMHTGDAGTLDERGYLFIQDRIKDMIVTGGENVYPREVEEVLFQHPAVADAAVLGVPDERYGEAVKALVVLREGQRASAEEIADFCRDHLAGYKRPRSVDFVDALPRNPSGKVLKRELREKYWAGHSRRVS